MDPYKLTPLYHKRKLPDIGARPTQATAMEDLSDSPAVQPSRETLIEREAWRLMLQKEIDQQVKERLATEESSKRQQNLRGQFRNLDLDHIQGNYGFDNAAQRGQANALANAKYIRYLNTIGSHGHGGDFGPGHTGHNHNMHSNNYSADQGHPQNNNVNNPSATSNAAALNSFAPRQNPENNGDQNSDRKYLGSFSANDSTRSRLKPGALDPSTGVKGAGQGLRKARTRIRLNNQSLQGDPGPRFETGTSRRRLKTAWIRPARSTERRQNGPNPFQQSPTRKVQAHFSATSQQ